MPRETVRSVDKTFAGAYRFDITFARKVPNVEGLVTGVNARGRNSAYMVRSRILRDPDRLATTDDPSSSSTRSRRRSCFSTRST